MKYQDIFKEMRIINKQQLREKLGCKAETAQMILHRALGDVAQYKPAYLKLVRRDLYVALENGHPIPNRFEIACAINDGCYLSHYSAFELHGLTECQLEDVFVTSPLRFRDISFEGARYKWMSPKTNEGVSAFPCGVRATCLERTIADCIYSLSKADDLKELLACLNKVEAVDEEALLFYLRIYNRPLAYRRAGLILSSLKEKLGINKSFFDRCKAVLPPMSREEQPAYLVRGYPRCKVNYEWHMYAPVELFEPPAYSYLTSLQAVKKQSTV